LDEAITYLQQALSIRAQGDNQEALTDTLTVLAGVSFDRNECQPALDYVRRALDIRRTNNLDVAAEEELERRILEECQLSFEG